MKLFIDTFTNIVYEGELADVEQFIQLSYNCASAPLEELQAIHVTKSMVARLAKVTQELKDKKQELKNLLSSYQQVSVQLNEAR